MFWFVSRRLQKSCHSERKVIQSELAKETQPESSLCEWNTGFLHKLIFQYALLRARYQIFKMSSTKCSTRGIRCWCSWQLSNAVTRAASSGGADMLVWQHSFTRIWSSGRFICCIYKCSWLVPTISQMNPLHTNLSYTSVKELMASGFHCFLNFFSNCPNSVSIYLA